MKFTEQEQTQITTLLIATLQQYGKPAPEPAVRNMWLKSLENYEVNNIQAAFSNHITSEKWPPTIAHIVEKLKPSIESDAEQAWELVRAALFEIGGYRTVKFKNPVTMATVASMGSWPELCATEEKNLPFKKKEFIKLFIQYTNSLPEPKDHLRGLFGGDPVLIDNKNNMRLLK